MRGAGGDGCSVGVHAMLKQLAENVVVVAQGRRKKHFFPFAFRFWLLHLALLLLLSLDFQTFKTCSRGTLQVCPDRLRNGMYLYKGIKQREFARVIREKPWELLYERVRNCMLCRSTYT